MGNTQIFPSGRGNWVTARADGIQVTDQNCKILLPTKVSEVISIHLKADTVYVSMIDSGGNAFSNIKLSELQYSTDGGTTKSYLTTELTIPSSLIVEEQKWQVLPIRKGDSDYTTPTKNNTCYWTYNTNEITLPNDKSGVFIAYTYTFSSLISSAFYTQYKDKGYTYYWQGAQMFFYTSAPAANYYAQNDSDPMLVQFRVEYISAGESSKLATYKANVQATDFAIPFSQDQPIVSAKSLGRNMQSAANRLGEETTEVVRTVTSMQGLRDVGSYYKDGDDIWRLVSVNAEVVPDRIRLTETWSKNYSVRSSFVGVNRQFRSWNIPNDIVQRNLLYSDFLVFSKTELTELPQNAIIKASAVKRLMYGVTTWFDEDNPTEISAAAFMQKDAANNVTGAALGVTAFGFGNSLVFAAKTKDNLSAGKQRNDINDNDRYQLCRDVYYCNDDGTLVGAYVQMSSLLATSTSKTAEAPFAYPELTQSGSGETLQRMNVPEDGERALFEDGGHLFVITKDASEQLNFTYQLHLLSVEPSLIIGTAFAARNPLVENRQAAPIIKVWDLSKPIPHGTQTMTTAFGTQTTSTRYGVTTSNGITFMPGANTEGVCITDEDNSILLAFNGKTSTTFYTRATHSYAKIKEVLE